MYISLFFVMPYRPSGSFQQEPNTYILFGGYMDLVVKSKQSLKVPLQ